MNLDGLFTAIVTPFKTDESIDKDALRRIIDFQIQSRVDGIVPCTVTGENATLSHNEHEWVVELTVKYVNNKVGVIAATGSNCTREAIRLSRHAQKAGADAVLLVTPYLNLPSQRGLYLHFKSIARRLDIPCILFNLTTQTNVNIEIATLIKLIEDCPNITGFCDVSPTLDHARQIRATTPQNFKLYGGRDDQAGDVIGLGGNGLISTAANIIPIKMQRLVQSAFAGDSKTVEKIENEMADLFHFLRRQPDPVPVKSLLSHLKKCEASFRLPICGFEDDVFKKQTQELIAKLKLSV